MKLIAFVFGVLIGWWVATMHPEFVKSVISYIDFVKNWVR
jgi:hypothetical protein